MLIGIVIAALVVAGVIVAGSSKKNTVMLGGEKTQEEVLDEGAAEEKGQDATEGTLDKKVETDEEGKEEVGEDEAMEATVREVRVEGSPFKFAPNVIRVKKGDTVRVTFVNTEGFHDFVLDEFGVKTKQLQAGGQETVEFVANKVGTFEYYCSVGNHRAQGMVGSLIVE